MFYVHLDMSSAVNKITAASEVHGLHAFGEYDLVDGTCGREGEVRERNTVRNEGRAAAGRLKPYFSLIS